eukprot:COSAG03_NODE_1034_length_4987_cov_5.503069_1_plen_472_part_00
MHAIVPRMVSEPEEWRGWLAVAGGILLHLTLGTLYCFSNVASYLVSYMRIHAADSKDYRYADSVWIYAVATVGQACMMYNGGRIEKKIGPRYTVLLGGWTMACGVFLTSLSCGISQWLVLLTYGLMFGIGVGLCYSAPFVCAMRWLGPKRVGIAVGLVEAGFGAGAFIFNQVQTAVVNPDNRPRTVIPYNDSAHDFNTEERYFAAEDVERVPHMFMLLAVVYGAMQFAASLCMSNPPAAEQQRSINAEEVKPLLRSAATQAAPALATTMGLSARGMLQTRQFWTIWGLFSLNSFNIVAVASLNKTYGQTIPGLDDHFLSWVGSFGSLCNGLGRIFWGGLADRLSFRTAIVLLSACFSAVVSTLWLTPQLGRNAFFGWICAAFFCLGGNFSMFPSVTAKNFGTFNAGPNYGIVFTATITSGLVGAFYLNSHHPATQEQWREVFLGFGAMSAVAALLGLTYRPGQDAACGGGV